MMARLFLSMFLSSRGSEDSWRLIGVEFSPQYEGCFAHFGGEGGDIGFNAVIHGNPSEKLMDQRKGGICGRNETTYLCHHAY